MCVKNKMTDMNKIYEMLDWNNPPEIQSKGRSLAKNTGTITPFLQPMTPKYNKNVWENCAAIISDESDEKLEPHLVKLFEWIEDLNWPGALIILDRLKIFSGEKLKKPFIHRFNYADSLNNEEGQTWLDYLSELLDNESLKAELPKEIIEKLQPSYHNWGAWYSENG